MAKKRPLTQIEEDLLVVGGAQLIYCRVQGYNRLYSWSWVFGKARTRRNKEVKFLCGRGLLVQTKTTGGANLATLTDTGKSLRREIVLGRERAGRNVDTIATGRAA